MIGGYRLVRCAFTIAAGPTLILSLELQMRRPLKEQYRLDRLLERKAKEGVKIYIIL